MSDNDSGFSFVWKIENFSMLPHQLGECLKSPTFVVDVWEEVDFSLMLYPRGVKDKEYVSLYLGKEPEDLELKLNFTLVVCSTEASERKLETIKDHTLKRSSGVANFMSVDDIYAKAKHYLPQDTLTVRCEISPAEETSVELNVNQVRKSPAKFLKKHCVSRTCIQVQNRCITWSIRNVKKRIQLPKDVSILFATALKNSPSLKLTLNFNKNGSVDNVPITIQQTEVKSEDEQLFVKCKMTVTSIYKEYQTSKTSSHLFTLSTSDVWSFPPFITTSMLTDEKYLRVDDTLFLRCEFAYSYIGGVHHFENNYLPCTFETRQNSSELSTCFENIYSSGKFCDIDLKAGGWTFSYYKAVLCARSSVFSAMFENNMKEKASNVVEIEDVDPDTVQRMLTYMHSEVLQEDLSPEDACKLYRVADMYDLASLKNRCSVLLATAVSVLNVCDLLVFADTHMDSFLMTAVSDFICSHTTELFHSVQWETFMEDHSKLSCKVMHKMLTGKCQF